MKISREDLCRKDSDFTDAVFSAALPNRRHIDKSQVPAVKYG